MSIERIERFNDENVEVRVKSTLQGGALLRVFVDQQMPIRIHGIQLLLGG